MTIIEDASIVTLDEVAFRMPTNDVLPNRNEIPHTANFADPKELCIHFGKRQHCQRCSGGKMGIINPDRPYLKCSGNWCYSGRGSIGRCQEIPIFFTDHR